MALYVTCDRDGCTVHKEVGELYTLQLEQPYDDFDDITWYFCEEHIAEFRHLLPDADYVEPSNV